MKHISMLTKNETKYIQSLFHKKQRDDEKVFVAEGPKLAGELLHTPSAVKHIYATNSWLRKNTGLKVPATEVSEIELGKISNLQTPNEVVVIARQLIPSDEPVFKKRLTIVLDGIQDPGNMGTIIRIADWFGVQQIICSDDCVEVYNPKVIQSTMGSILRVKCWFKDFNEWKEKIEVPVFGALLEGKNIYAVGKTAEGLVVTGNESKGIREPLISKITDPVTIPKAGGAESLNAAVATGIIVGCLVNGAFCGQ
jgi:TrmH family RNA methyltransferase